MLGKLLSEPSLPRDSPALIRPEITRNLLQRLYRPSRRAALSLAAPLLRLLFNKSSLSARGEPRISPAARKVYTLAPASLAVNVIGRGAFVHAGDDGSFNGLKQSFAKREKGPAARQDL